MLLDDLRVDYAMKRGHEMIVDLKSGVERADLDAVEIQMLQGQRIPKLLPVEWIDIDGGITFRYPLNGRRMLSHRLQTRQLTMFQFYALLLAVVEALDDSRHYMLRAECFLLHEQYIFIGENWDDAVLAYVPLRGKRMVHSAGEAVLAMAIRWIGAVAEPDGLGLQQVFQHLRGEYVSWTLLRQTLLSLLGSSYRAGLTEEAADVRGYPAPEQYAAPPAVAQEPADERKAFENPAMFMDKHEHSPLEAVWNNAIGRERMNAPAEEELPLTEMPVEAAKESSRMGWLAGAGWILAAAVIWRFLYLASPSRTNLLLCAGLTLLTGTLAIVLLKRAGRSADTADEVNWRAGKEWSPEDAFVPNSGQIGSGSKHSPQSAKLRVPEPAPIKAREPRDRETPFGAAAASYTESSPMPVALSGGMPSAGAASGSGLSVAASSEIAHAPAMPSGYPLSSASPANGLRTGATSSSAAQSFAKSPRSDDVTVLLGRDAKEDSGTDKRIPWLERRDDGGVAEKIPLEQQQFVIGRSREGVQYIDRSSGISRAHVELHASGERWCVKDMGSRNGSTLNGSGMVPYKTYELADTDKLQLAGEQGPVYVFRAG
ncbi:FHA domain-containing protein [Paenibacillus sp. MWE-103]|uniref:FHA domain-containing protein n=1 Tax=Paenibacillus artemisiicola TaxID=1172618 RepID=A0ABS3WHI3_9BACL|nr:DUF6382 domain-containing protein [Paenibacillus artemisiicola]MBO7747757.1 FHA domain-containing protein [Paenibacillus artemisiicola]